MTLSFVKIIPQRIKAIAHITHCGKLFKSSFICIQLIFIHISWQGRFFPRSQELNIKINKESLQTTLKKPYFSEFHTKATIMLSVDLTTTQLMQQGINGGEMICINGAFGWYVTEDFVEIGLNQLSVIHGASVSFFSRFYVQQRILLLVVSIDYWLI